MIPKRAQQIAEQIEREILNRRLPTGHRVGSEPELTAKYGVSRAVLREAIRLVERHQLAETRRGNLGGLFVAQPAEEAVVRVLCAYLESIGIELDEIFEAGRVLEPALVHLAAIRTSPESAKALEDFLLEHREFVSISKSADLFDRYYTRVGEIARNPILRLFVCTTQRAGQHFAQGLQFGKQRAIDAHHTAWKSMRATARAIADHDAERAEQIVQQRIEQQAREWRELPPRKRRPSGDALKRGDWLAREIGEEIRREEYQPGDFFGSETELLSHYGVSRASLREAIRMLEQHGIAEMRRGLDGGLIVAKPDPEWVIRSASTYLAHQDLTIGPIKETCLLLEPFGAALATERASDEALAELAVEHVRDLTLDGGEAGEAARNLHEHIADLSGNRPLALFTRVIITAAWGGVTSESAEVPPDAIDTIRSSDTRIVGALQERNIERVRRLVEIHLEITLEWWSALHRGGSEPSARNAGLALQ